MARLTLPATGPAAPATVWERYVRVDRWASWSPQIRAVYTDSPCIVPELAGTVESFDVRRHRRERPAGAGTPEDRKRPAAGVNGRHRGAGTTTPPVPVAPPPPAGATDPGRALYGTLRWKKHSTLAECIYRP
jgi:hypothetical protein